MRVKDNVLVIEYPTGLVLQFDIRRHVLIWIVGRHSHDSPATQFPLQSPVTVGIVEKEWCGSGNVAVRVSAMGDERTVRLNLLVGRLGDHGRMST